MIRQALIQRAKGRGLRKSQTDSLPSPTGGWNARDPLAAMSAKDAIVLENWWPEAAEVILRRGATEWESGFADPVLTLMPWNGPASSKFFGATDNGIFEITDDGAVGAADETSTSGRFQYVNFTTVAGTFLVAVNGVDDLKLYNGTTWQQLTGVSTPAITGVATADLVNVCVIKKRLWFVEKDSTSAWYLPAASVGGALEEFPLGQNFLKGGYLVAMGNWTVDGGDGQDDYAAFMSSEGEVAIYKGTDPASSSTFNHVGTYAIGEPLGKNCLYKYGGDLLVLCHDGIYPLSKALQSATIDRSIALTSKIDGAFLEAVRFYSQNEGWQIVNYPQASLLIVNIPTSSTWVQQYVMNTVTGAWSKFTGWQARCWEVWDKKLYFGSATRVARAWDGTSDFGAVIACRAQQAYSYFKYRGRQKHFKLVRPTLTIDGNIALQVGIDVDFARTAFSSVVNSVTAQGDKWDTAIWDQAVWGGDDEVKRDWLTVFADPCYAAAFRLQCSTNSVSLKWSATDFVFEVGGVL